MIVDAVFSHCKAIADGWKQEADRRRRFSPVDPVADTLEHCASELRDQVEFFKKGNNALSVEDFARDAGVTPQTVRTWIRDGELAAVKDDAGRYHIRRGAKRRKAG